jgi:rhodanese-related sulfurtransferase
VPTRRTIDDVLADARAGLRRLAPEAARAAVEEGGLLIDIRQDVQLAADGDVPGALRIHRNVLEWRCDPSSDGYDGRIGDLDRRIVVMCDEGYTSSLAAAALQEIGFAHATDLEGGFQAWRAAGLPVEPSRGPADAPG